MIHRIKKSMLCLHTYIYMYNHSIFQKSYVYFSSLLISKMFSFDLVNCNLAHKITGLWPAAIMFIRVNNLLL